MIKFEFYDPDSVNDELIQSLWDQNVCMDDWDYMLFFPDGFENWMDEAYRSRHFINELRPKNSTLERLLTGCCFNKWYAVANFNGRTGILGVSYHS